MPNKLLNESRGFVEDKKGFVSWKHGHNIQNILKSAFKHPFKQAGSEMISRTFIVLFSLSRFFSCVDPTVPQLFLFKNHLVLSSILAYFFIVECLLKS